jgi:uncharacterized membrane protein YbhN (UPF0104 family)
MPTLKNVTPWLIAALILYFLFSKVDYVDAWSAASEADLPRFLLMMTISVLFWFFIDSAAFAFLFTRFNGAQLDWAEARSLRGLTYLVTPINWNLGTAGVILHLRTSKQIGALESASTMVLYQMIDGLVLGSFALAGVLMLPASPEITAIRNLAMGVVTFQTLSLAFFSVSWQRVPLLERYRNLGLFQSHRRATLRDFGILISMKSVYFAVFLVVYWLGCDAFGINLPISVAAAAAPLIIFAGALPFTPAGLGTQQAAMLFFFAPYGDEASILAFGLMYPLTLVLMRALLGLPYLKDLSKLRTALALNDRATQ